MQLKSPFKSLKLQVEKAGRRSCVCNLSRSADTNARMDAWETDSVYSGSYSLPDDVAAAQSDYETRHSAHSRRAGSRRAPMVPALQVFDLSAVRPLRHKGLLYWGEYGPSSDTGNRDTVPRRRSRS